MITANELKRICPAASTDSLNKIVPSLSKYMEEYSINTKLRKAHFIAQLATESVQFNKVRENLNYSEKGLLTTFPKYFNAETAKRYARKPQQIANIVYANRGGNGNTASNDGWSFIGRGLIQITLKDNYNAVSDWLFGDDRLIHAPQLLEEPEYAVKSAIWFYCIKNNLNIFADKDDVMTITRKINGGYNGLKERKEFLSKAKEVFK